jgi:hypothetical protein
MSKMNCWEFRQCGREVGGSKTGELGICPAASDQRLNGVHDGLNAGRSCWMVAGTLCNGQVQGTFAQKMKNCLDCDFYNVVRDEERSDFKMSAVLMKMLEGVPK